MDQVQKLIVLSAFSFSIVSIFLFTIENNVFAIEYTNYISEKYGIQFEFPSEWQVTEKTSRFDDGSDIKLKSGTSQFNINRFENTVIDFGASDIETATEKGLRGLKISLYGFEVKTIEEPSYLTINGYNTGTFLITFKDKYEDFGIKGAQQQWIVFVGNAGYMITFIAPTSTFDSPENIEFRDHFIKSIKFLGINESQQKSRFD
jgi:hypothetical protein